MENEISKGVNLGVLLLALAAVITIGFGVFMVAKALANDGTVQVQDSLATVNASQFADYDQKVVTGTQVMSAYKTFEKKPYLVAVATKAFITPGAKDANGAEIADTLTLGSRTGGTQLQANDNNGDAANLKFIMYNALFNVSAGSDYEYIDLNNGVFVYTGKFAVDAGGTIMYNTKTGGFTKSGNCEYIPATARFEANLIKDKSGTIMGMAFRQVGN